MLLVYRALLSSQREPLKLPNVAESSEHCLLTSIVYWVIFFFSQALASHRFPGEQGFFFFLCLSPPFSILKEIPLFPPLLFTPCRGNCLRLLNRTCGYSKGDRGPDPLVSSKRKHGVGQNNHNFATPEDLFKSVALHSAAIVWEAVNVYTSAVGMGLVSRRINSCSVVVSISISPSASQTLQINHVKSK